MIGSLRNNIISYGRIFRFVDISLDFENFIEECMHMQDSYIEIILIPWWLPVSKYLALRTIEIYQYLVKYSVFQSCKSQVLL